MGNNVQHAPEKTINGTFGEVWIDDYYAAETTGLEAKVTLEKTEVNQTGSLAKGYKVTGIDCKGTVKMNKVTSFFINLLSENIKGIAPECNDHRRSCYTGSDVFHRSSRRKSADRYGNVIRISRSSEQ